ncbi:MAG TPA: molybdopterin-dependent oxidoreductase [Candidatus Binatia bacterium]|nr:molybdopterin-dependent oxidoreductase [Candidatus Binatia bacterium]
MKRRIAIYGAVIGAMLTAPLVALTYLGNRLVGLPFIPFDLFDWVTRVLPGPIVTFGIDTMIDTMRLLGIDVADTAKTAEQMSALLQFLVLGVVAGAVFALLVARRDLLSNRSTGVVMGALLGLPLIAISTMISQSPLNPLLNMSWLALLFLGWGLSFRYAAQRLLPLRERGAAKADEETRAVERIARRQFLIRLGASTATVTVLGSGVGALLARSERQRLEAELAGSMAHETEGGSNTPFPNADDPVSPAPGTRPEYTPLKDHYKVFIRTEPTVIDGSSYVLPITGLVDTPLMLTLDDLRSRYPARDQYVTLSCISGRVGTTLISTTQWTGASLQEILADARVQPEAQFLIITSGDGFHETVSLRMIEDDPRIMLCYDWDGNPLPVDHGFPLRIWIPDRFGMKQPKWITGIEVTDSYEEGYWVQRNWDEVARVQTTSVIDTVAVDAIFEESDQRLVPIGGIAFAGARGISKVEVRMDGGAWQEARLRAPLSETTWVIWRYDWPFSAGDHTFEVRCVDGQGTQQIEDRRPARPSGATGIHSREVTL